MRAGLTCVVVALLAACGQPAGLDRDEATVSARTCASLLERAAARSQARGDGEFSIGGEKVDLYADPEGFYRTLASRLGPEVFVLLAVAPDADRHLSAAGVATLCRPDP